MAIPGVQTSQRIFLDWPPVRPRHHHRHQHDALEFARRCADHLHGESVNCVEAWSVGAVEGPPDDLPGLLTFRIVPHENGKDWQAVPCALQHPLWIKKLEQGIDYMMFRAAGTLCRIEVLSTSPPIRARPALIVLADRRKANLPPSANPFGVRKATDEYKFARP
jgi:hypothetical protein